MISKKLPLIKLLPMDESRRQDYLNLINALLSCPSGGKNQILNAHSDLVDAGLVDAMLRVANEQIAQDKLDAANFLMNLARQLMGAYGNAPLPRQLSPITTSSSIPQSDSQRRFLLQVLQAINENPSNLQTVLYLLLQKNLNLLDDNFVRVLRNWATASLSKVNLDEAYTIAADIGIFSQLIQHFPGERAINLEIAIAGYEVVTTVFTSEVFATKWAMIQTNLGAAYANRIKEKRAENIEKAINAFRGALNILTHKAFPREWASIQNNLGAAYIDRIKGERSENIEQAIEAFQNALLVRTPDDFGYRYEWAETQTNLGSAYAQRINEDKNDNLELAITAFKKALSVYTHTCDDFRYEWARVQNNLGVTYIYRISKEKDDNLELAITAFQNALSVYTRDNFPYEWAGTKTNLGIAYTDRIRGKQPENLELAIQNQQDALSVRTPEVFPTERARTQINLANAYAQISSGKRDDYLKLAIKTYQEALSVYIREAFPQENTKTLFSLGLAYQKSNQLQLAYDTFGEAIKTVEFLRNEICSGDNIKQKLAEEWNKLYQSIVKVCLVMSSNTEAIEYVERSKTRNLVELILSRDLNNLFSPDVAYQLRQLEDEIAIGQDKIQTATADEPTALAQHLQQLRQQRNELQNRDLPIGYGFKFDQFQATLDDNTAVVEFYFTGDKLFTFIFTNKTQQPIVLQSEPQDMKHFEKWFNGYLRTYNNRKSHWQRRLNVRLHLLAKILHINEIIKQIPEECDRLILIPHRFLHLFPLHALPFPHNGKTANLLDRFPNGVSYAPSCQLLLQAQKRKRPNFTHLFAIQNPTNDLAYTDLEVQAIKDYFNSVNILEKETATLTAINDTNLNAIHCAHFSCHGYFNPRNARKSALIPAETQLHPPPTQLDPEHHLPLKDGTVLNLDQCLTLDAIFSLNLEQCRLVTLSACETGLIDFKNISDEYIGLPSGFLIAGSPSVVSSLWRVDDIASAFLMIKFYQNLKSGSTVAIALNQAQTWLRDATTEQLQQWASQLPLDDEQELQLDTFFYNLQPSSKPFESPYHWAAFCAIGQ